jgi:diadenosine tetraphosphate (Ap4A) HIT family hydrolase
MDKCAICTRLENIAMDAALVHEFANSYLLLGNHQYFRGYCILLYKWHVRELHELDSDMQTDLNHELMLATQAVVRAFNPWKMNHACLGNRDQHIHWHIIPRYETEADHQYDPWKHADEFDNWLITDKQKQELIALIKEQIT